MGGISCKSKRSDNIPIDNINSMSGIIHIYDMVFIAHMIAAT